MAQLKDLIVNGNARIITDLNVNGYETVDETVKVGRDPTANLEVATKQYVDNNSGGGSYNAEGQDPEDVFAAYQSGQSVYYDITSTNYSGLDGVTLNGAVPILSQQPQFYGRYYLTEVPYETFDSGNDTGWYIFTKAGYTKSEYINSDTKIRLYNYSLELYDDYGAFNQAYLYGGYSEAGDNTLPLWRKSSQDGLYRCSGDRQLSNADTVIGAGAVASGAYSTIYTASNTDAPINSMAAGEGSLTMFRPSATALSSTTSSGATSYSFSANAKLLDGDLDYIKSLYFFTTNTPSSTGALHPSTVSQSNSNVITLTFSSSLNPTASVSYIYSGAYNVGAGSVAVGGGIATTQNTSGNLLIGERLVNSNFFSLQVGQSQNNSGGGSGLIGVRLKNSATGSLLAGNNLLNAKNYSALLGQGHDSTNGIAGVTAVGNYSVIDSNTAFAVGVGTASDARSNAFEVHADGRATIKTAPTANMDVANKQYVDNAVSGASSPVDVFAATIAISGVALDTATITLSNSKTVADLYGSKPAALYIKGFNSATSIDFNVLMLLNVDDYSPSNSKIDGIAYCGGGKQLAIAGTFAKTSTTITGTLTNTPKAPQTATVTLASDSWSGTMEGYMQTVTVTGMTASATVWVAPAYATLYNYAQMYTTDKIVCSAQAADSLTFRRYASTSSGNIVVNITWIT